jgi:signal transduction histidine kinase
LGKVFVGVISTISVLVFCGGLFLVRHVLRPVSAMTVAAERISAQAPDERLPLPSSEDEIARLSTVLNESFDRLQRAYNSAARFSADASHQLKTPIAVLRAGLEELRMCDYLQPQDRETVDTLLQQTRRLTTLVEDLLLLAQADAGRLKLDPMPLDLVPLLGVVLDDTEVLGMERDLVITLNVPDHLFAKADPRRVKIILQNLTENAVKYNYKGGKIRINARREGNWIAVSVANTGGAIPEQYRDRLFERFNRAGMGENIKGHGLGLNIARELARAHGGDLSLIRSEGSWTEFSLRLPATETPALARDSAMQSAAA